MKLRLLALIARALGIQFKVDGLPYGACHQFRSGLLSQSPQS
jgi:hypothetical protein